MASFALASPALSARAVAKQPAFRKAARASPLGLGRHTQALKHRQIVRAQAEEDSAPARAWPNPLEKTAAGMGYDTSDGLFGFNPFAELWTGRLAMMGFTVGLAEELWTGDGILGQIGVDTPNGLVFAFLMLFTVGGSAVGAANTLKKVQEGEMSLAAFKRYVDFFGADLDTVADQLNIDMKKMGDFTSPDSMRAINAARKDMPANEVLSFDKKNTANDVAADMKAAPEAAVEEPVVSAVPVKPNVNAEMAYALDVELNNGRWAMVGFALAIILEAQSGNGIVGQLITYGKISGLLGADSGF